MRLEWRHLEIELNSLCILKNNPRIIKDHKFENLKTSIDDLGIFKPLVIDFDKKTILAGNQRYRAMLEAYSLEKKVNCMIPNRELTSAEREKIILMDNLHLGEWDFDILANEFDIKTLKELDLEIPLTELPEFGEEEGSISESEKSYLLEVQLTNELEMQDLRDDLASKGYIVREK